MLPSDLAKSGLECGAGLIKITRRRDKTLLHRGSYMSAHVLLNLLNEWGKRV